ncbi:ead/Ea22-like family protein [Klebsiella pneumoniae]|uniref:ead/Ea22-like family protein n=1 Tax=Klebsiella pneumoniae TaxID=573 RepID=UPI001F61EEA7|nr:ead/Ea22-like family protein [Klebsiella pneumoniae]
MTTDITELAQSLKAAANKAGADDWQAKKISGEFYVIRKGSYSSKCGYRTYQPIAEIDHKSTRDYVAIASPANILALVEALEKAQQVDEELCKLLPPGVEYMDPPDGGDVTPLEGVRRMVADYRQLIAELESRTVTVKMPKPHAHLIWIQAGHAPDDYWDDVAVSHSEKDRCCDGSERYPVYARWEIEGMLTAAGIKWEAE